MQNEENKQSLVDSVIENLRKKECLRTEEVSALFGLTMAEIYNLANTGSLPYHKKGRTKYFKMSDLLEWQEKRKKETQTEEPLNEDEISNIKYDFKNPQYIHKRLAKEALNVFGEDNQIMKLLEEMSELQEAILKHKQGRDTAEHVQEEIADVRIMLAQMDEKFGAAGVYKQTQRKIERLKKEISKRKQKHNDTFNPENAKQGKIDFEHVQ